MASDDGESQTILLPEEGHRESSLSLAGDTRQEKKKVSIGPWLFGAVFMRCWCS